jgi:hypothetical protein
VRRTGLKTGRRRGKEQGEERKERQSEERVSVFEKDGTKKREENGGKTGRRVSATEKSGIQNKKIIGEDTE